MEQSRSLATRRMNTNKNDETALMASDGDIIAKRQVMVIFAAVNLQKQSNKTVAIEEVALEALRVTLAQRLGFLIVISPFFIGQEAATTVLFFRRLVAR
jgi:hypothetical protein